MSFLFGISLASDLKTKAIFDPTGPTQGFVYLDKDVHCIGWVRMVNWNTRFRKISTGISTENQLKPVIKWDFLYSKEKKFYMMNTEQTSLPGIFRIGDKWKFFYQGLLFGDIIIRTLEVSEVSLNPFRDNDKILFFQGNDQVKSSCKISSDLYFPNYWIWISPAR